MVGGREQKTNRKSFVRRVKRKLELRKAWQAKSGSERLERKGKQYGGDNPETPGRSKEGERASEADLPKRSERVHSRQKKRERGSSVFPAGKQSIQTTGESGGTGETRTDGRAEEAQFLTVQTKKQGSHASLAIPVEAAGGDEIETKPDYWEQRAGGEVQNTQRSKKKSSTRRRHVFRTQRGKGERGEKTGVSQ